MSEELEIGSCRSSISTNSTSCYDSYSDDSSIQDCDLKICAPINAKMEKENTSKNISSFAWCSEYTQDIIDNLKEIEKQRKRICFKSRLSDFRPNLITLIKEISENFRFCRTTVHLAVYMLDVFMDSYKILEEKLKLVALVCLFLSAKMEEHDRAVPKLNQYISNFGKQYSKHEFKMLELKILSFFNWTLLYPTAVNFVNNLISFLITPSDFSNEVSKDNSAIVRDAHDLAFDFLDITLLDRRLVNQHPSLLAASCLVAVRKISNIAPYWPKHLQAMIKYDLETLNECVETLIFFRKALILTDKLKNSPDSGFISDTLTSESESDSEIGLMPCKRKKVG